MKRRFTVFFILFPCILIAQREKEYSNNATELIEIGETHLYNNQDSAYYFFEKAYQLASTQKDWENSIYALQYINYTCGYYYNLSKYKVTIDQLDSLLFTKKKVIENLPFYAEANTRHNFDKVNYYYKINHVNEAQKVLKIIFRDLEGIPILQLTEDGVDNLFIAYEYAGALYDSEEKYDIAEQYYRKSLRLYEQRGMGESEKLPVYNLLAALYTSQKYYQKSNKFLSKTLKVHLENPNKYKNNIITSSVLMAQNHIELNQLDSTKYYLHITKSVMLENDPFLPRYYEKLAEVYKEGGQPTMAFEMYNKSLAKQKEKWKGTKNSAVAKVYNKTGQLHESQNDLAKALENYQEALQQLAEDFDSSDLKDNPSIGRLLNKTILFETLKNKSGALNKASDFLNSLASVDLAIVALDSLKPTFESEGDKQLLIENAFPLFESGMEAAYQLYESTDNEKYIDQAFSYSEKGKSVILLEALLKTRANDFAKIPLEIIEKEKQLKSLITYLEKGVRGKQNNDFEEQLFNARNEYRQLIKTIETKYKKYYDLKYNTQMATVAMVQNHLKSDEALISYFYGDRAIYSIMIGKNSKELNKVTIDDHLGARINTVYQMLGNPKSDVQKLASLTNELYISLLAPSLKDKKYNKLIIITDGLLNYIPFGSLNTTKEGIQYLIENNSISYSSSATLLLQLKGKNNGNNKLLGFAPSFDNNKKTAVALLPIPNNKNELQQILSYFKGKSFIENNASLQNFNTEISNYGMIHLATHAVVNDNEPEYSYLAFSPTKEEEYLLFVSDIYNLDLNANLVTLSACESGMGDLKRGEGLISLSRGFFYSGAASIVNTMWKINDASSSQIMNNFYKHLADGESKETALQNAKLDFLKGNRQNSLTHPYFWSGFVIAGDTTPVVEKKPSWIWLLGGLLVMAMLGMLLYRRRPRLE